MRRFFYSLFFMIGFLFLQAVNASTIVHLKIDGAISPASAKYLKDAFLKSYKTNAHMILIELDTPGGLATSMREMIQDILNSSIPVVMYVSPKGARAASAGTFLMYASHITAMSPGTNIGAATPVNLMQAPKQKEDKSKSSGKLLEQKKTALEKKVLNDSVAYIKSIAEHTNRNIKWAQQAVKEGKSISAKEAKENQVIEYIANDVKHLLKQIHNTTIVINDKKIVINTKNAKLITLQPSWKTKLLMVVSNPNIAYVFLILAMYGIVFEMMNPGSIFPGVIGVTSALVAMYALNILPFNYVGLLLIMLGILFMIGEVFLSGFGIMGIMGVVAFAFGSILLFDEKTLGIGISMPLIISLCVISFAFFVFVLGFIMKTRNQPLSTGSSGLIGTKGTIVQVKSKVYKVMLLGEIWNATSQTKLHVHDEVEVIDVSGLTLKVRSTS